MLPTSPRPVEPPTAASGPPSYHRAHSLAGTEPTAEAAQTLLSIAANNDVSGPAHSELQRSGPSAAGVPSAVPATYAAPVRVDTAWRLLDPRESQQPKDYLVRTAEQALKYMDVSANQPPTPMTQHVVLTIPPPISIHPRPSWLAPDIMLVKVATGQIVPFAWCSPDTASIYSRPPEPSYARGLELADNKELMAPLMLESWAEFVARQRKIRPDGKLIKTSTLDKEFVDWTEHPDTLPHWVVPEEAYTDDEGVD
ncbi:uncharacterized protein LTR77_007854 [Saxophila tyrrhenica]|uniref:Uncharacterized protein n=1 Tax=Saxophila tyrrhenica TaxID=1690608 RepID=A0AAV9P583_9PEZI|nr:hypothetical protein LTR77_007854 [Saxophila tyrrhenica]